jgi:CheY-like chemotaxis protein
MKKEEDEMSDTGKRKILLVDDEEGFTTLMKIQLEASGSFEVRVVNESVKTMEVAKEYCPDVILLDVVMPDMDGGDISAALKNDENLCEVPVVIVTALSSVDSEEDEEVTDADVDAGDRIVLSKPVSTEKLLSVLGRVLGD